jgi:hypothetical protein
MERKCRKCNEIKPLTEFYKTGRKNDKNPNERHHECKECTKARVSASHKANPDKQRDRHLRRNYGITLAQFNCMVLAQGSKCACCGTDKPGGKYNQWCVDHDHVTGAVRELLCKDCNIVLGIIEDSPEHLQRLLQYIIKHNDKTNYGADA